MNHGNRPIVATCKALGLACHDTLENLLAEAVKAGRLNGDEVVRLSIEIASPDDKADAIFNAVTPMAEPADRGSEAA